jgi:NAD+ diphosphatase
VEAQPDIILDNVPPDDGGEPLWFLFREHRLLVAPSGAEAVLPAADEPAELGLTPRDIHYLGRLGAHPCFTAEWPESAELPAGHDEQSLRGLLNHLDDARFTMASRAIQLLRWYRDHRYCGRCGHATISHERDKAMICPQCDHRQYPRITPCVIMLVTAGEQALLARSARFPAGFYSCLAGFMEPGESAEQAVQREVREETGVDVDHIAYHGSQPWPFPHSLMLGFRARHRGGAIVVDGEEILDADWWWPDELPRVPPKGSIARALIDDWLAEQGHTAAWQP